MSQTMDFLAQYAGELVALWRVLVSVLLLVILHRMRRITKLMQGIAGNTKQVGQDMHQRENTKMPDAVQNRESLRELVEAQDSCQRPEPAIGKETSAHDFALQSGQRPATVGASQDAAEEQQKLLSAVLDEVFP